MPHLHLEISPNGVATVILDNPPQNRISDQMVGELHEANQAIESSSARAILLMAAGQDFSFGGDIMPWPEKDARQLRPTFERYMRVFNEFERLPIPTIAAVQGACLGGGLELAVRADIVFAAEAATFGHPEQSIGIVTLLGGVYRIAEKAGRAKAAEWSMTSQRVSAAEMASFGVVNRVVADDQLVCEATDFAQQVASGPTRAYAAHKTLLRTWAVAGVSAADEILLDLAMPLWDTQDVKDALPAAVRALKAGQPRPAPNFQGR
jgi:enoyl-CoA hydratase/carnithine racemase